MPLTAAHVLLVCYKILGGSVEVRKIPIYGKAARDSLCRTLNIPHWFTAIVDLACAQTDRIHIIEYGT